MLAHSNRFSTAVQAFALPRCTSYIYIYTHIYTHTILIVSLLQAFALLRCTLFFTMEEIELLRWDACLYVYICACMHRIFVYACLFSVYVHTYMHMSKYSRLPSIHPSISLFTTEQLRRYVNTYLHMRIHIHIHACTHTCMQATRTYTTEKGINADNFTMTEYVVDPYAKPLRFTEQRDEYCKAIFARIWTRAYACLYVCLYVVDPCAKFLIFMEKRDECSKATFVCTSTHANESMYVCMHIHLCVYI